MSQVNYCANNPASLRYWIAPLLESKQVVATGQTAGRRFSLPGRGPDAALDVVPARVRETSSSTDLVNRRDDAIAMAVKRSKGPAAFIALMAAMPDEKWESPQAKQEALSNVLRRLRAKQIVQQVDGGWAAA